MNWLKNIKKLPWGLISVLIGLSFGIIGLLSTFYESKPNISFEITGETNVLDIYKPLEDLNIVFQGDDIQKKNLNLRILTLRIENNGNADILQNYYDSDDIWGFKVENGKIIEVRCVDSNSDYIKSKLNPQLYKENIVQFTKVILEKGKFFIIEVLVLHIKDRLPSITPTGKIAGIDKIIPIKSWLGKEKQNFLSQLFAGKPLVQIIRPLFYLILWIIFLAAAVFLGIGISLLKNNLKQASRRSKIKKHFGKEALEIENYKKRLLDIYVKHGSEDIKKLQGLLENEEEVRNKINMYEFREKRRKEEEETVESPHEVYDYLFTEKVIYPLIKDSVITRSGIAPELTQTLNELLKLIKTKEQLKSKNKD